MFEYIREQFSYNVEWRYKRNMFIRFFSMVLLLSLFFFSFNRVWEEVKPITGYYNEYLHIDGTAIKEDIVFLENSLDRLPKWLIETHQKTGGIIYLKSTPFEKVFHKEYKREIQPIGTFHTGNNNIKVFNEIHSMENTLFHEYGHFLDKLFSVSDSKEFQEIFEAERSQFREKIRSSDYYFLSESEYFAEAFSIYISNGNKLEKYCPMTYNIIEKYVERGTENEHRQIESKA